MKIVSAKSELERKVTDVESAACPGEGVHMSCLTRAYALIDELIVLRSAFHRDSELGFQEYRTAQKDIETLHNLGVECETGIAKTGVVTYLGEGKFIEVQGTAEGEPFARDGIGELFKIQQAVLNK